MELQIKDVRDLLQLFLPERIVYLTASIVGCVMVVAVGLVMIERREFDASKLSLVFGSSGLLAISAGRILRMWNDALLMLGVKTSGATLPGKRVEE